MLELMVVLMRQAHTGSMFGAVGHIKVYQDDDDYDGIDNQHNNDDEYAGNNDKKISIPKEPSRL